LSEKVQLGILPKHEYLKDQATSRIVGSGTLSLDRKGLHYVGSKEGQSYSLSLSSDKIPTYGMCTDVTRFYTFDKNEFIEFFPEGETVMKWIFATEELHRLNGGAWKNFPDATANDD
jgi:hypothetical protein